MLSHSDIWRALDLLAQQQGLTASGLARRAGLDPTTFNRSKRQTRDGKLRWPSTESLAKVLDATSCPLRRLVDLVEHGTNGASDRNGSAKALPLPRGYSRSDLNLPSPGGQTTVSIQIGTRDLEPIYRSGDVVAIAPEATVRQGDRVLVHTYDGVLRVGRLARQTAFRIDLDSLEPGKLPRHLQTADIAWMARIVWASQ